MLKIILAIVLFSVIVIFHELGHFLFAKKNGICVEEFAIGSVWMNSLWVLDRLFLESRLERRSIR